MYVVATVVILTCVYARYDMFMLSLRSVSGIVVHCLCVHAKSFGSRGVPCRDYQFGASVFVVICFCARCEMLRWIVMK